MTTMPSADVPMAAGGFGVYFGRGLSETESRSLAACMRQKDQGPPCWLRLIYIGGRYGVIGLLAKKPCLFRLDRNIINRHHES